MHFFKKPIFCDAIRLFIFTINPDPNARGKREASDGEIEIPEAAVEDCQGYGRDLSAACEFDWVNMGKDVSN